MKLRSIRRVLLKSFLLLLGLSVKLCADALPLRIAVAANLVHVMDDLKAAFLKSRPELKIDVISGSSGKLTEQIINGAPFDIFMSADMGYPKKLKEAGFCADDPMKYAQGRLIIFAASGISLENGVSSLKSDKVKKIAIANPKTAPYGKAALEALAHAGIIADVESRVVNAPSVAEVVALVQNGADAGFTALSILNSSAIKKSDPGSYSWKEVDQKFYTPLDQGMVILKRAGGREDAELFFKFILSDEARKIFVQYGYR